MLKYVRCGLSSWERFFSEIFSFKYGLRFTFLKSMNLSPKNSLFFFFFLNVNQIHFRLLVLGLSES